jgi:hypothetical protein
MATENPFVYGEIVPASAFVDRQEELARLAGDLAAGQKVFLISPRRYGKSSLVRQAMRHLARQRVLTLEITVSSFSSYVAFLEGFARALMALETRADRLRAWVRDLFGASRPELRHDVDPSTGKSRLAVTFPAARSARDVARLAEGVFALPQRIAEARGARLAVSLDEFQDVAAFNGGSVEQALRAAVQQQRQVGYVFAGSEPTLMERMIGPRRPFYKAGPVMRLQRIPADVFAAAIDSRFRRTGLAPEPGLGEAVVELGGNLPYDVQRLAHETWDDARSAGRRRATVEDLHGTLRRLLAEQDPLYEALWQRLTLGQRAVLRAVVVEQGRELLSAGTRDRHRLGGPSTVQAALLALQRSDLVSRDEHGRYAVVDSLLREWVARRTY